MKNFLVISEDQYSEFGGSGADYIFKNSIFQANTPKEAVEARNKKMTDYEFEGLTFGEAYDQDDIDEFVSRHCSGYFTVVELVSTKVNSIRIK